jgi:hypothetical protein
MSERLIAVFLGAVAIAAIAAGCGGGSDTSSSTAVAGGGEGDSSLSKAAFIQRGDALCAKNNTAMAKQANELTPGNGGKNITPQEAEDELVTDVFAPGIGRQAEDISSLGAPAGEEDEVEAIVAAIEAGAKEAEQDPSSFGSGAFSEASELARAYGFKVCGGE